MMNRKPILLQHGLKTFFGLVVLAGATVLAGVTETAAEAAAEKTTVFYVAPNGSDANPGDEAKPFATLARARDAIRQLKANAGGKLTAPVTVLVRGGKYSLAQTLTLSAEDSGAAKLPVVYRAYSGETPVLSSRLRIAGWKPWKEKILQADVPQEILARWDRRQLFLDGKRQTRARFPKADPADPWRSGLVKVEGPAEKNSYTAFKYPEGSFPRQWAKPAQAEIFIAMQWGYTTLSPLKSVDWQNRTMVLTDPVRSITARKPWDFGWPPTSFDFFIPFFFYVENVLEELTAPGEWCVDAEARKVFFWPPEELTEQSEVSVPVLDCLIDVSGASWVTLDGFTFTGTRNAGNNMHRAGHHGTGAMYPDPAYTYCGEAIRLKQAEYCRIVNSRFVEVGGNAICAEGYNLKNVIQSNEIGHVGHCGITVIGAKDRGIEVRMPIATEIADNHIHHCGVYDTVAPGVFCGVSIGTAVRHNLIEQMPHHGINLGASGYGGNLVEYNRLRFCCMRNYDIGVINCWMEDNSDPGGDESLNLERDAVRSGHVFRYNHISDTTGRRKAPGEHSCTIAIYLDSHTSNCRVYGNILECNQYRAVRVNGGRNNVIENNIIVDCGEEEGSLCLNNPGDWPIWPQMKGFMIANRFCRNICLTRGLRTMKIIEIQDSQQDIPRALAESDYNLFFNADGGEYTVVFRGSGGPGGVSFAQWQETGNDAHSRIADPLFVDAAKSDFRLKPESPALKLGFVPIPIEKIGIRAAVSANQGSPAGKSQ